MENGKTFKLHNKPPNKMTSCKHKMKTLNRNKLREATIKILLDFCYQIENVKEFLRNSNEIKNESLMENTE